MNLLQLFGYSLMTGASAFSFRSGTRLIKEADREKKQYLQNIKQELDGLVLPDNNNVSLIQFSENSMVGLVEIYRQAIIEKVNQEPYQSISFGFKIKDDEMRPVVGVQSGVITTKTNEIGYEYSPFKRIVQLKKRINDFNLVATSDCFIDVEKKTENVTESKVSDGNEMQRYLKENFYYKTDLDVSKIYKSNYYSLQNRSVFAMCKRLGTQVFVHAIGPNPEKLAEYETSGKRETGSMLQLVGVVGMVGFGTASLFTIFGH